LRSNILSLAVVVLLIGALALHPPSITWSAAKVIGAIVAGAALPLFLLARWQLGASFSVRARAHALVTTGLYARFRNPIYLFGGLVIVGLSLFVSVWGPLVVAALLVPLQMVRARREEQVLARAFGEEYERYKRNTWF